MTQLEGLATQPNVQKLSEEVRAWARFNRTTSQIPLSKPKYGHPHSHFPHHRRQQEKHKLVSEVMRYMLFSQYRDGAPVQKPKLSEHLSKVAPELKRAKVSTTSSPRRRSSLTRSSASR